MFFQLKNNLPHHCCNAKRNRNEVLLHRWLCVVVSRLLEVPNGMLIWVCGPACMLATKIVHPITHPGRCPAGAQWTGRWQGYDPWPGPHSVTKHTWHEMSKCFLLWTPKEPHSGLRSIHIIGKPFYQPYPSPWLHKDHAAQIGGSSRR